MAEIESKGYEETKECACTICGEMVTVTKFASASKVKCVDCKKEVASLPPEERPTQYAQWSDVKDKELRNLCCLSCGEDLVLISVTKSEKWGDIVTTQCPSCFLSIMMSEQSRKNKWMMKKVPLNHLPVGGIYEEDDSDDTDNRMDSNGVSIHSTNGSSGNGDIDNDNLSGRNSVEDDIEEVIDDME